MWVTKNYDDDDDDDGDDDDASDDDNADDDDDQHFNFLRRNLSDKREHQLIFSE